MVNPNKNNVMVHQSTIADHIRNGYIRMLVAYSGSTDCLTVTTESNYNEA